MEATRSTISGSSQVAVTDSVEKWRMPIITEDMWRSVPACPTANHHNNAVGNHTAPVSSLCLQPGQIITQRTCGSQCRPAPLHVITAMLSKILSNFPQHELAACSGHHAWQEASSMIRKAALMTFCCLIAMVRYGSEALQKAGQVDEQSARICQIPALM